MAELEHWNGSRFVGRERELSLFAEMLADPSPRILHLAGVGGIGKTHLVDRMAKLARVADHRIVRLDGRVIEPSIDGLLRSLASSLDRPELTPAALFDDLAETPTAVFIDTYEMLWLLDSYIRTEIASGLPTGAVLVLAGRDRPSHSWLIDDCLVGRVQYLELDPLTEAESVSLLRLDGLAESDARAAHRAGRGHPLSLTISAALAGAKVRRVEEVAAESLVESLAVQYLDEVSDSETRQALEAASVVRRITESLMAVMIPDRDPADMLSRVDALPFVERGIDGVRLHDTLRDSIAASVRATNPEKFYRQKVAAWRRLRREMDAAPPHLLWRYTADVLHLLESAVIREASFPTGYLPSAIERADADDWDEIVEITEKHESPDFLHVATTWWRHHQSMFKVARRADGGVDGYCIFGEVAEIAPEVIDVDPAIRAATDHATQTCGADAALMYRRILDRHEGEGGEPTGSAVGLHGKSSYVALRPRLRHVYVLTREYESFEPMESLGFVQLREADTEAAGSLERMVFLDMGPGSVDGWLSWLAARELGLSEGAGSILDHSARELVLPTGREPLTRLEYGVLAALAERQGRPASRAELIRDVWGFDTDATSNVVDAVVATLRRKLGTHAHFVETVRGTGYRLADTVDASVS